jgi:hypothetical protein
MLVAAVVTVLALPFLLSHSRGNNDPAVATADGSDLAAGLRQGNSTSSSAASSSPDIGFLNGPETTLEPAPILVGVPPAKPTNQMDAKVGYRTVPPLWRSLPRPCIANTIVPGSAIPVGTALTIVNLSNSHTTTCIVATHLTLPADQPLQLTESVFSELGDQIDAPLSVRISWK